MYESPIHLMIKEMAEQVAKQQDEMVFSAVQSVMPTVNREELLRALKYDRDQYEKGYTDGKRDAKDELVRCKDCKYYCKSMMWCNHDDGLSCPDKMDFCSYGERKEDA